MKKHWAFPGLIVVLLATALISEKKTPTVNDEECKTSSCCTSTLKKCSGTSEDAQAPDTTPDNLSHQFL